MQTPFYLATVTAPFRKAFGLLLALCVCCLTFALTCSIPPVLAGADEGTQENSFDTALASPPSDPQHARLIKLTDKGIEPQQLQMTVTEAVVFFLNSSIESLTTIEVDYGGRHTHCATKNLSVDPDNKVYSKIPFGPGDFASLCFHEPGDYPFRVFGLEPSATGLAGIIHVTGKKLDEHASSSSPNSPTK